MRLLANENIPLPTVADLQHHGLDVTAIGGALSGIKDRQVLQLAREQNRVLLTFDRDYGHLIYKLSLPVPPGVLYLRFQPRTPTEPAELILELLELGLQLEGWFTVLERDRVRQRTLPPWQE